MKKIFISVMFFLYCYLGLAQERNNKTYYQSGKIKSITFSTNNVVTKLILYYENGNKKKESHFGSDGKLSGLQIEYFENGKRKKEVYIIGEDTIPYSFYTDSVGVDKSIDVASYKITEFYPNGKEKTKGYIVNGMRSGYWVFYNEKGEFDRYQFYKCLSIDE